MRDCTTADIREALYQCPLFSNAQKESFDFLLSDKNYFIKHFGKGEFIVTLEESKPFIGIIVKGAVEVQKLLVSGNIVRIMHKEKGDAFGGGVAFSFKKSYPCDIYAKKKGSALFFHKDTILALMRRDQQILTNVLTLFAKRLLEFEKRIELFSYSSIKQKIAFYLLDPERDNHNNTIRLPFSKATWASYLNVSRPSLCRELRSLSDSGVIAVNDRNINIVNKEGLTSVLMS